VRSASTSPREDLPPEFAGKFNPLAGAEAVAAGASLFQQNCATCHGTLADGHGPAATGLEPPPANFRGGPVLAAAQRRLPLLPDEHRETGHGHAVLPRRARRNRALAGDQLPPIAADVLTRLTVRTLATGGGGRDLARAAAAH